MDVVEMDAASEAGVDDVRETIVEVVEYKPAICRFKVFIIDEVHDLSPKAFDALLKTIEEPPSHVVFVLATTELHKVPPTIQSRCQKFSFSRAKLSDLQSRLTFVLQQEGREYEDGAVTAIARLADGGFRDALSLLEQAILTTDGVLTQEHVYTQLGLIREEHIDQLILAVIHQDSGKILDIVDDIYRTGREAKAILEAMMRRLADLTRIAYSRDIGPGVDATIEAAMKSVAAEIGSQHLLGMRHSISRAMSEMREVTLPKLWLESRLLSYGLAVETKSQPQTVASPKNQSSTPAESAQSQNRPASTPEKVQDKVVKAVVESKSSHEPAAEPPKESSQKRESNSTQDTAWNAVIEMITQKSRAAAAKLNKTKISKTENGIAIIEFERQMDRDWVAEKQGLIPLLKEEFEKHFPGSWSLELQVLAPTTPSGELFDMGPTVEMPLEGKQLNDVIKEEFEGF